MADSWRGFASDNYAGVHPEVLAALAKVNEGHAVAYGDDLVTEHLQSVMRKHFGEQAQTFPVFNGTGANVVSLQAMTRSWEAIVCAAGAHINVDEGGAPEKVAGLKLYEIQTEDGRLTPEQVLTQAHGFGNEHRAQPRVLSITQATELGTVYQPDQIRELTELAHSLGMFVHLDGSRIANAAAALNLPVKSFTTDVGVDVVSLGGTKNGAMAAEAVVVLNPDFAPVMKYVRKTLMQLGSKMRYMSAQLIALYEDDLWLRNAQQSNAMALRLWEGIHNLPEVRVAKPEANSLFPYLPHDVIEPLQEKVRFYTWNHLTDQVRWMCSWDTTEADVDNFIELVKRELS